MAEKEVLVTQEGYNKLVEELRTLKTVKRKEVADRIKTAIEFGDLSENAEYDDAKNEQAFIEGKIASLEKTLRNARIVDENDGDGTQVNIGSTVELIDVETGDQLAYTLVGFAEANPMENRISNESPVGKALLGKQVGDVVEVLVPAGVLKYEVKEIRR